jgi:hypothetical protein
MAGDFFEGKVAFSVGPPHRVTISVQVADGHPSGAEQKQECCKRDQLIDKEQRVGTA